EGCSDPHIAKPRWSRAMSRAHGLHRLPFAAVRRPPQRPIVKFANRVARIPEFGGDSAIAWILQHAHFFPALNLPADFGRKLKLVSPVINGPRPVRVH